LLVSISGLVVVEEVFEIELVVVEEVFGIELVVVGVDNLADSPVDNLVFVNNLVDNQLEN
jgi:hypothetical protein